MSKQKEVSKKHIIISFIKRLMKRRKMGDPNVINSTRISGSYISNEKR